MTEDALRSRLADVLTDGAVLTQAQMRALDPVIAEDNTHVRLAVAPFSTSEISDVFRICSDLGVPLVPQGGRTGLAGGATGTGVELLLLGHNLPSAIEIDALSRTVTVSANTTLARLEAAVKDHGLTVGIDLAARDSATIGGMISTNAGGMEAFRNGTMRQRVLGLQAVLPDGTLLDDLSRVRKCNEGYDIKQLLIGAEGTLGVVTCAVLQLLPASPEPDTFLLALPDAAAALLVLKNLQSQPHLQLLRAEAMWQDFAQANGALQSVNPLQNLADAPLYVIYEVHCTLPDAEAAVFSVLEHHLEDGIILDAVAAQSGQQAADIWALREDTLSMQSAWPHAVWFDISVPLAHLDAVVKTVETRVAALDEGLRVHVLGHLGDGNLHYSITRKTPIPDALADRIKPAVLDGLKDLGGSFSAEHGIGTEKRVALQTYGDPGKLSLIRAIKAAIDPAGICNPGKVL